MNGHLFGIGDYVYYNPTEGVAVVTGVSTKFVRIKFVEVGLEYWVAADKCTYTKPSLPFFLVSPIFAEGE